MKKSTRRDFLKNSTLGTLGVFSSLNSTFAQSFFESFINFNTSNKPFLIDVIRYSDLLHLKLHLYNVSKDNRDNLIPKKDFYMFVQLPSQHIAEELITELTKEQLGERKKSFLAGSSWLVLKHIEKEKSPKIKLTESYLLDWANNFELVTLDHLKNSKGSFSELNLREKRELLCEIKKKTVINKDNPLMFNAQEIGNQNFSSFEVPYKMHLSPISEAIEGYKFERHTGRHTFSSNNLNPLLKIQEGANFYSLYRVWENQLHFQAIDGNNYAPRFKVVTYKPQCDEDKDCNVELLPQPTHREELNQLTMLPFNKRDVVSNFFKISALGVSTKLKYENEQPIKNTTIVSWKQHIKYARDNYVSITFRAIDVFTGLKLLVSIVAERKFQDGKSFLLKRYFISYLEPEKEFEDVIVIGKMTFKKIIALSKGEYFSPIPIESNKSYHVQKESSKGFKKENDLIFKYIGIDKKGKEHEFSSKIIFIPAECYKIIKGTYSYNSEVYNSDKDKCINIRHIGGLNPYCQVECPDKEKTKKRQDKESVKCFDKKECKSDYEYCVKRNFEDKNKVQGYLSGVIKKINDEDLREHYSIQINNEVTFADISTLQIERDEKYLVNPKSDNATFKTRNIFLFTTTPEQDYKIEKTSEDYNELDCCDNDVTNDPFSTKYPLIPFLHHAEVVIPQISQIEGKDVYRTVALTDSLWKHEGFDKPIDFKPNSSNKYQLLFKLVGNNLKIKENPLNITSKPLSNFFSNNYRNSGGAVNPGITISHISVLDNGITYNEKHNEQYKEDLKKSTEKGVNISVESPINTNTVFEALEAEIFGISLIDVVGEVIGIDELPNFNFIKDADKAFNNIKDKYESLKGVYSHWQEEYDNLEKEIKKIKDSLDKHNKDILIIKQNISNEYEKKKKELKSHLNAIISKSNLLSKYESGLEQVYSHIPKKEDIDELTNKSEKELIKIKDEELLENFKKSLENFKGNLNDLSFTGFYSEFPTEKEKKELEENLKLFRSNIKSLLKSFNSEKELLNVFSSYIFYRFLSKIKNSNDIIKNSKDKEIGKIKTKYNSKLYFELYLDECIELKNEIELDAIGKTKEIKDQWNSNYSAFVIGVEKASKYFQKLNLINAQRLENQICLKTNKILTQYGAIFQGFLEGNEKAEKYLEQVKRIEIFFKKYEFYKDYYNSLKTDFILNDDYLDKISNEFKASLVNDLNTTIQNIKEQGVKNELYKVCDLIYDFEGDLFKEYESFISEYNKLVDKIFYNATKGALTVFKYEQRINKRLEELKTRIREENKKLKDKEELIKGFFDKKKKELDEEYQRQIKILQNDPRNIKAQKFVKDIREFKERLQEATTQKLNYQFKTKNFKNTDLGIISFIPTRDTELTVNVNYSLEFNIPYLGASPALAKQSFLTDTSFVEFQIGFLKLIYIDFEKIRFISGSDVKDDFQIKIRDVQFAGCLSFVDAIQEYLNGISNNLIFEVNSSGAMVNYILPPFSIDAPPFKFFNISFSALLILPFDPKKSLQLQFGLGSPLNKFGLIYGAFGGQGYFNIIVEPKQGVVGLEVVLEFGAIYYANIGGVAKGVAYLVGGIYIKRYYGKYQIKAYILCVGRFSILGIFSASASFYLGLEGDGNQLSGVCVITFTKRFSSFFKIKVKATMRKTIYGTNKSKKSKALENKLQEFGYQLIDTNIFEELLDEEELFIRVSHNSVNKKKNLDIEGFEIVDTPDKSSKSNCEVIEYIVKNSSKDSLQKLKIKNDVINLKQNSDKVDTDNTKTKQKLDKEYYQSIFI